LVSQGRMEIEYWKLKKNGLITLLITNKKSHLFTNQLSTNPMYANYDPIAKYYDPLSRLIFGKSIRRSQQFLLEAIPAESTILIVGGGTGWILEDISARHQSGLNITYVEQSVKMMEISKRRYVGLNRVVFRCQPIQSASLRGRFDVVIVPFLFDNFSPFTINHVFQKIDLLLNADGLWLFADFTSKAEKPWTKILLKLMYTIFGPLCNLETSSLPDSAASFQNNNYKIVREALFYKGFISSIIYRKTNPDSSIFKPNFEIIHQKSNNSTQIA